jgi:hypothetical protein
LGDGGTTGNTYRPVKIANNVVSVAAGAAHALFVAEDGSLWSMGYNNFGQLGVGSIGNPAKESSPVLVSGLLVASLGGMGQANHSLAVAAIQPQIAPLVPQSVLVGQGANFTLNVTSGTGPFAYQWQINGANIANATNRSYAIASARDSDAGTYTGIVNGMGGTADSTAILTVSVPPSLAVSSLNFMGTNRLNLQVSGLAGSNYVLQVTTNLAPPTAWVPLQTNVADLNGACTFAVTNLTIPEAFYRIALP